MLNDNELLRYNREEIIPGPGETEEELKKRADYCFCLRKTLPEILGSQHFPKQDLIGETAHQTMAFYGIAPTWIPLFFSNEKLAPWHGGCAWIFQETESTPTSAFFQLRKSFFNKESYLGMYDRKEIICHELAHVGRMMFEESKYEEVIAYQTSSSRFRRWFGPIVQSSWEALLFVMMLITIVLVDAFVLLSDAKLLYGKIMWLKAVPLIWVTLGLLRLWKRQRTFWQCLKNVKEALGTIEKARAVIFRLTDQEIDEIAVLKPEEFNDYANQKKSLRWKFIKNTFFL